MDFFIEGARGASIPSLLFPLPVRVIGGKETVTILRSEPASFYVRVAVEVEPDSKNKEHCGLSVSSRWPLCKQDARLHGNLA